MAAWMVYGLIPQGDGLVGRWREFEDDWVPSWTAAVIMQAILDAAMLVLWLALVMYLSTLWRDRLDVWCVKASMWGEEVLLGKRTVIGSIPFDLKTPIVGMSEKRDVEAGPKS